jgi:biotin carboxyl carrier protein
MKWLVDIGGRTVEVNAEQLAAAVEVEPGVYSILHEGQSYEVRVLHGPEGLAVEAAGGRVNAQVRDPRDYSKGAGAAVGFGRQNIHALMPGKVIRVLVQAGESVEIGQGLVVVEAMKMQNETKATRPGHVAEVCVQDGDTVGAGDTLLVLE